MNTVSILTHSFLDGYNGKIDKIFGGGLERYLYDLCEVIREMGWQPVIHQLSFRGAFETEVEGIRVIGHPCSEETTVSVFQSMSDQAEGFIIYASFLWEPLDYRPGSIGICHGINWDYHAAPQAGKAETARWIQRALNRLERIVSVDSHFLTFCRAVCSFADPEKVLLLPNAVDTNRYTPGNRAGDSQFRLLYPRRISLERGIVPMMLVADHLLQAYGHVVIEFAGEMIEDSVVTRVFRSWLRHHPFRERIQHRVYTFEEMPQAYRNADLVVIPTLFSEGTSYSCLEALSSGVPVVASNVGGLNDLIIDGFNGRLVAPTEERLTGAIRELIEDREARQVMGRNARATAIAFDRAIWKRKWKSILAAHL